MYKVKFSTLSYYPDIFLKSNLAVGVAFQVTSEYETLNSLKIIPRRSKISSFDDEIDIKFINVFLEGIKDEFEKLHQDDMGNYLTKFVNNFKFEELQIKTFSTLKSAEEFIDKTYKYILHLGIDKDKRLNEKEKKDYIESYLLEKYSNLKRRHAAPGNLNKDTMYPDFTVENEFGEEIFYKLINNSNQAVHNAKSYMMYALYNKKKLVFILEDNMEAELDTLSKIAKDLDIKTKVIAEKEVQKL